MIKYPQNILQHEVAFSCPKAGLSYLKEAIMPVVYSSSVAFTFISFFATALSKFSYLTFLLPVSSGLNLSIN